MKHSLKSIKENNTYGITLIALVITIIVLLILAGVSIATLTGPNGLLTRANDAKTEMRKAEAKERVQVEVAGSFDNTGKLDVNRLSENLQNIEGIDKTNLPINTLPEIVIVDNNEMVIDKNGNISNVATTPPTTQVDKVTIFKDSKSENKKVVIPKGFKVSGVEKEQIIDKGLVVIAPDGSEFVWIPVDKKTLCVDGIANKEVAEIASGIDYRGVLYDFSSGTSVSKKKPYNESSYREPTYLTDSTNGDTNTSEGHNTIGITQELLQKEYNGIIKSIQENGGFYIGRYESSLSDSNNTTTAITGNIQSKKGIMPASSANEATKAWYGLYVKQKEYAEVINAQYKTEIKSGMIYGSMYDAVMNWALNDENETNKVTLSSIKHGPEKTGTLENDIIKNIYDLGNNLREWTVEAHMTNSRVNRGRLLLLYRVS